MQTQITKLTDSELRAIIPTLVATERHSFIALIEHLAEIDARALFTPWGYSSLWDYATRELNLRDGVAYTRITLARLIRKRPEIRALLLSGKLGQCQALQLNDFAEAEDFSELLEKAQGMSKRELQDFLAARRNKPAPQRDVIRRVAASEPAAMPAPVAAPVAVQAPVKEEVDVFARRPTPPPAEPAVKTHRIGFTASERFVEKLKRAQDLANCSEIEGILDLAIEAYLEKNDPVRREERRVAREAKKEEVKDVVMQVPVKKELRRQPQRIRDLTFIKGGAQCEFVSASGVRCHAKRFLQYDHKLPFALGGSSRDLANQRLLCAAHNRHEARVIFGSKVPRRRSRAAD